MRRHARAWERSRSPAPVSAFVPLSSAPGEAHQSDWSHGVVLVGGATVA